VSADKEYPGTARRKHRHDLGHEDHGPVLAEGTTKAIQAMLGLWIALTFAAVLWAMVDAGRAVPRTSTTSATDAAQAEQAPSAPSARAAR
jgi:hypothetical protein